MLCEHSNDRQRCARSTESETGKAVGTGSMCKMRMVDYQDKWKSSEGLAHTKASRWDKLSKLGSPMRLKIKLRMPFCPYISGQLVC